MQSRDRLLRLAVLAALVSCLLDACAVQSGLAGGVHLEHGGPDQATWSGHLAAMKTPEPGQSGMLVGVDLQGSVGVDEGTRWLSGMRLGVGWAPASSAESMGYELHLDLGTEMTHAGLLEGYNGYVGGTLATVVWMGGTRTRTDLNGEQWVLKPMPELVIFGRGRASQTIHCDNADPKCLRATFEVGIALRMALLSEFL
jgi:hypothetical protein